MEITSKENKYLTFNTSTFLMESYEDLAILVSKEQKNCQFDFDIKNHDSIFPEEKKGSRENIKININMLNLNAAIVEGTIRQLFSSILNRDHHYLGDMASKANSDDDKILLMRAYKQISTAHINNESQGGWENLRESVNNYLDIKIDDYMNDKSAFKTLFQLRNAIAHGTALIAPVTKMSDDDKGTYLFKWQSKLQESSTFILNKFGCSIFKALERPDFSIVFWEETTSFMKNVKESNFFKCDQDFILDNFESFAYGQKSSFLWKWRKSQQS